MTINKLMNFVVVAVIVGLIATYTTSRISLSSSDEVIHEQIVSANAIGHMKDARYYVVQVQQFLTDVGATRDREAVSEAKASLDAANASLDLLVKQLPEHQQQIKALKTRLKTMYQSGMDMAEAYVVSGTEAGNKLMKGEGGLDDLSSQLSDELAKMAQTLSDRLQASKQNAEKTLQFEERLLAGVTVFVVLLLLGAVSLLRQKTIPKLRALEASFQNIADGAKDLTVRLDDNGNDELSHVAQSFNRFVGTIHELIMDSGTKSSQLSAAGEQMASASEQTLEGMKRLQRETDAVLAAVNEMKQSVAEVAQSTEVAAQAARESDQNAREVEAVVKSSSASIVKLADGVQHSSKVLKTLEEKTESVGSILDVIRDIADQTNLLALNAAIEAARAGEQGRGFAVVADEVRTLAQRTQESTEQIQHMISELQHGAEEAVAVMDQSRQQADDSVKHADEAGVALAKITRSISDISATSEQVAAAMDQQSSVAEEIGRSMAVINDEATSTNENAYQSNEASKQVLVESRGLKQQVDAFKV